MTTTIKNFERQTSSIRDGHVKEMVNRSAPPSVILLAALLVLLSAMQLVVLSAALLVMMQSVAMQSPMLSVRQ